MIYLVCLLCIVNYWYGQVAFISLSTKHKTKLTLHKISVKRYSNTNSRGVNEENHNYADMIYAVRLKFVYDILDHLFSYTLSLYNYYIFGR